MTWYSSTMKFFRYWGPVFAWMAVIFFFSTRQRIVVSQEELLNFLFFKSLHVIEYAFLYFLTYRAMKNTYPKMPFFAWAMWSFVVVIAFAMTDEIHQLFVPTREGRLRDVIIDTFGATIAWTTLTQLLPKTPKKLQRLPKNFLVI